jgi:uncharacterized protein YggE
MHSWSRAWRWIAGMALVAALIAVVLLAGHAGSPALAQAAQTPGETPTEDELLETPTPTEETPTPMLTETPTVTRTETPGIPETDVPAGMSRTLIVVGEGRVQTSPDIATANIGVTAVETSVVSATQQVSETMAAVIEALMQEGVAPEDIQTTSYSINLIDGIFGPQQPDDDQPPRYQVTNSVQVTIRDIAAIGTTIDAAVEAGANQVFGVSFDLSNREERVLEAMEEAIENAEARAQHLADLTGTELGPIVSVSQVVGASPFFTAAEAALGAGGAGPGPISPGQLEITTQVQVAYELQ